MEEKGNASEFLDATIIRGSKMNENAIAKGKYFFKCYDKDGNLKWEDTIDNVITNFGANQLLESAFGAGPIAGPFLGLISSVGYTGVPVAANTMTSHATWNEAGNGLNYPNWSTPASNARATVTFGIATGRSISLTAPASFVIAVNGGTLKGAFLVFGTGAVDTNGDTNGVLYSAGLFNGGDKIMAISDTLNVNYATSI